MVKNELPNLLVSQEMNYPTHFSSVPTRGINSERSLKLFIGWFTNGSVFSEMSALRLTSI